MASTHLTRTPSSDGNRRTFTISMWLKKLYLGITKYVLAQGTDSNNNTAISFNGSGQLSIWDYQSAWKLQLNTTQVFRDVNAWYHIVLAVDTTQATASDRAKLYVNGTQVTDFSTATYPTQNTELKFNSTNQLLIGAYVNSAEHYDGLMAHIHSVDGTAHDASTFGSTDSTTGIWKPKTSPSVTYGTNGFFLDMADSSNMGNDVSGNNNDFSVGAGTITQTIDTPSNVFATWNPLNKTVASFSNGNLSCTTSTGEFGSASTLGVSQGKYYAEFKVTGSNYLVLGVADENGVIYSSNNNISSGKTGATGSIGFPVFSGVYRINNSNTSYGSSFSQNDIASIAIDCDNQKIYLGKNGTWQNSADPVAGTGGIDVSSVLTGSDWFFTIGDDTNTLGSSADANFGNGYFGTTAVASAGTNSGIGTFEYDVPQNYKALCTKSINEQEYS